MDNNSIEELKKEWSALIMQLSDRFDQEPDLQAIIFLIGVQELGKGYKKFSKDEKQDLMHIATCRLLSRYGYYSLTGYDNDGWPEWKLNMEVPKMGLKDQDILLKRSVLAYFRENKILGDL